MHNQLPSWQLIQQSLQQQMPVMLLYVIESKGSSPGRQGFLMVVNSAGNTSGSLGGGIMEHKFVEMSKTKLQQGEDVVALHQQLHDKAAAKNQSGMICSGEQTIFLYRLHHYDLEVINAIVSSFEQNKNGALTLSPTGVRFSDIIPSANFNYKTLGDDDFLYIEKTGYKQKLFIIGGGHCALALSRLMSNMDFYIQLIDDRNGLHTIEQNTWAHQKQLIDSFEELQGLVPDGKDVYVTIMTVGYRTDETALRAILGKQVAYIGLLGSKEKIGKMFIDMKASGISSGTLKHIYAPVGLAIKSQTPQEIAVSIAAQIIEVKNRDVS